MRTKLLHEVEDQRTYAAILETGEEVMDSLRGLARRENLSGAQISGIGAFSEAVISYFDWETKDYLEIPVREQVEVASLIGDIGLDDKDMPALHVHLVLGRRDGGALAGHLVRGTVRPTLELIVTESPAHLCRRKDRETGLNLIRF